jgi:hypothetical protein
MESKIIFIGQYDEVLQAETQIYRLEQWHY